MRRILSFPPGRVKGSTIGTIPQRVLCEFNVALHLKHKRRHIDAETEAILAMFDRKRNKTRAYVRCFSNTPCTHLSKINQRDPVSYAVQKEEPVLHPDA